MKFEREFWAFQKRKLCMDNCKICNKSISSEDELKSHIKEHDLKISDYFKKHYRKKDLFSGKLLEFKTIEQYLGCDFESRENLISWLIKSKDINYACNLLQARKEKKSLVYTPCHIECTTTFLTTPAFYNQFLANGQKPHERYNYFCFKIGLKSKYKYDIPQTVENEDSFRVIIDTREQKPLDFDRFTMVKLDYGDYKLYNDTSEVYFERKSLPDLIGTLSEFDRFDRELARAQTKLTIVVECGFEKSLHFDNDAVYKKTKVTPSFIFRRVRELIQKYPNIQFLFVNGRGESVRVMEKIFKNQTLLDYDLQHLYELREL